MKKKTFSLLLFILVMVNAKSQEVAPMLPTVFNQSYPFNAYCPGGSAAGCGPIAIAQILTKYKAPSSSVGSASYVYDKKTIDVNLDGITFDWNNIRNEYSEGKYDSIEAKAVAELVYACGAAMNVTYGDSTSVTNYARMLFGLQHNMHMSVRKSGGKYGNVHPPRLTLL